jgi:hypothetical protein
MERGCPMEHPQFSEGYPLNIARQFLGKRSAENRCRFFAFKRLNHGIEI